MNLQRAKVVKLSNVSWNSGPTLGFIPISDIWKTIKMQMQKRNSDIALYLFKYH